MDTEDTTRSHFPSFFVLFVQGGGGCGRIDKLGDLEWTAEMRPCGQVDACEVPMEKP